MNRSFLWSVVFLFCFAFQSVQGSAQCVSDIECEAGEVCAPDETCVPPGQDVGSEVCRRVQRYAQQAVLDGSPFLKHGHLVRTAARVVSPWLQAGIITEECSGAIMHQFGQVIPIEEQEATGPDPECLFTIAATLVAEPGSDYDTLGFTGSTFLLEIQTDSETVPTIQTLYIAGTPYTVSEFDFTSSSALHWSPLGSSLDGDYAAPVRITFTNDRPSFFPGIPYPVGLVDEIELNATVEIAGDEYELRMLFYYNDSEAFEEFQLNDACTFESASAAAITVQQLQIVPYSAEASYDLRVADIVFTTSQ